MTDIKKAARLLSAHSSFIVTTHKNCDGDGLGAGAALCRSLRQIGKEVFFLTLDAPPARYAFLEERIQIYDSSRFPALSGKALVAALDVNDSRMLEPLYGDLRAKGLATVFIDHHPLRPEAKALAGPDDCFFVDSSASSTGETVYEILKELQISVDEAIATALWTSIVFDTKMFRNIKNSKPFAVSAELVPYIRKPERIYENLFKLLKRESLGFFSCLERAEFYRNDSVAVLRLAKTDFQKHGAETRQAYDLLDILMNIASMEAAVLILDGEAGSFKLSFRSREKSVLKVAESFGGGGHHRAAGAYVRAGDLQEIKQKARSGLLEAVGGAAAEAGGGAKGGPS